MSGESNCIACCATGTEKQPDSAIAKSEAATFRITLDPSRHTRNDSNGKTSHVTAGIPAEKLANFLSYQDPQVQRTGAGRAGSASGPRVTISTSPTSV